MERTAMIKACKELKRKKNAVILAHYYAPAEAQELADHVGDSFYLAKMARQSDADIIVFCGVSFMGESAKLLCPDKKVLMPDLGADCAMAHMASEEKISELRRQYDDLAVVCYINSTARLKALSDVCVTSSNAVKIVSALPNKNIFFIPDAHLGAYVKEQLAGKKNIILNDGYCPVHTKISKESVSELKQKHPEARVLAHPECKGEVLQLSDFIGSTLDIIKFAKADTGKEYIVCTEVGVEYKLKIDSPDKSFFFPSPCPCCGDMKLNTPENIYKVLDLEINEVEVDGDLAKRAMLPLERMLELGK